MRRSVFVPLFAGVLAFALGVTLLCWLWTVWQLPNPMKSRDFESLPLLVTAFRRGVWLAWTMPVSCLCVGLCLVSRREVSPPVVAWFVSSYFILSGFLCCLTAMVLVIYNSLSATMGM